MKPDKFMKKLHSAYAARRPRSKQMYASAGRFLPGGDTRSVTFYHPFPAWMRYGRGFTLVDVDGLEYIDFQNNYTSLIHGHAHPKISEAVTDQIRSGTVYGAPTESQLLLAKELCQRIPGADKMRFCNSGTEATMLAIGLARYITGRHKILKMEGGYHGSYDSVQMSIKPPLTDSGPVENPYSVPAHPGMPPNLVKNCVVAPFNTIEMTGNIISTHHRDLAAIIVEPVAGSCGMIPPLPGFLEMLREMATRFKILLIFDEVLCFRLAWGGCQERYGIYPDLTTLGKIIGGGFPVGALAGTDACLGHFAPDKGEFFVHSGTFNGNPATMTAGLAAMNALTAAEIDRINQLGKKLRDGLRDVFNRLQITAQVIGAGSLAQVHFTEHQVKNWRSAATARTELSAIFHLLLLEQGIFTASRACFNISTPMGPAQVDNLLAASQNALTVMKPYIEQTSPELIAR